MKNPWVTSITLEVQHFQTTIETLALNVLEKIIKPLCDKYEFDYCSENTVIYGNYFFVTRTKNRIVIPSAIAAKEAGFPEIADVFDILDTPINIRQISWVGSNEPTNRTHCFGFCVPSYTTIPIGEDGLYTIETTIDVFL